MLKGPSPSMLSSLFDLPRKIWQIFAVVGEEALELFIGLLVLLLVEHAYGPAGLGLFAFLMALMFVARYITVWGITRYVEIETAKSTKGKEQDAIVSGGLRALIMTSLAGSCFLFATSGFDARHTLVGEWLISYFFVAALLPFANLNALKFAILNGRGEHGLVARHRLIKHIILLVIIFFLTSTHIHPSFLLVAYLLAEFITAIRLRRSLKFPKFRGLFRQPATAVATLKKGQSYLFTDNGLDLLLNIDFFILGLFVNEWRLGVYAEAAMLVRLCLIISLGLRPILRRRYTLIVKEHSITHLLATLARHSGLLFTLQGGLALLTLLYFPMVFDFFFAVRTASAASFEIFLLFVPGLLFFTTFSTLEPVFEATGKPFLLKKLTITVTIINIILTSILVSVSGIAGAATATMLTMLVHFLLFIHWLPFPLALGRNTFITAAMALYIVYQLFGQWPGHPMLTAVLAPCSLILTFYGCGLYGVEEKRLI